MSTGAWKRRRNRREHRWSWPRISDYIDGDLARIEQRRLTRHADTCPECGPLLRSLLRVVGALHTLRESQEPSIVPSVLERVRAEGGPEG